MQPKGQTQTARPDVTPPQPAPKVEVVDHIPVKQPTEPSLPTVTQLPKSVTPAAAKPVDESDKELDQILKETSASVANPSAKNPERQLKKLQSKKAPKPKQSKGRPSTSFILLSLVAIAIAALLIILTIKVYRNGGTV